MFMHSVYNSNFFKDILLQDIVMYVSQWHFRLQQCIEIIYLQLKLNVHMSLVITQYLLLVKGNRIISRHIKQAAF